MTFKYSTFCWEICLRAKDLWQIPSKSTIDCLVFARAFPLISSDKRNLYTWAFPLQIFIRSCQLISIIDKAFGWRKFVPTINYCVSRTRDSMINICRMENESSPATSILLLWSTKAAVSQDYLSIILDNWKKNPSTSPIFIFISIFEPACTIRIKCILCFDLNIQTLINEIR